MFGPVMYYYRLMVDYSPYSIGIVYGKREVWHSDWLCVGINKARKRVKRMKKFLFGLNESSFFILLFVCFKDL